MYVNLSDLFSTFPEANHTSLKLAIRLCRYFGAMVLCRGYCETKSCENFGLSCLNARQRGKNESVS